MGTEDMILEEMIGELEQPEVTSGASSDRVAEGVEGSRCGDEEECEEGCLEGAGGFEGPVEFRMGQMEAKPSRVARSKQLAG